MLPKVQSSRHALRAEQNTISVGQRVKFRFGGYDVSGRVIEDRGNIGVSGRRLLRVRFPFDTEILEIELPAEELKLVAPRGRHR